MIFFLIKTFLTLNKKANSLSADMHIKNDYTKYRGKEKGLYEWFYVQNEQQTKVLKRGARAFCFPRS